MRDARSQIEGFGGSIDAAVGGGDLDCQLLVDLYDAAVDTLTLDVAGSSEAAQYAYNSYQQAVDIFSYGAHDLAENCRGWLADPDVEIIVTQQQWGFARQQINEALEILIPALEYLEQSEQPEE